jgi:oligogalacturonide lyase
MAMKTPQGIAVVTLADWSVKLLVPGPQLNLLFTGHKSRNVYYASRPRDDAGGPFQVFAADVDTGMVRKVADVAGGSIGSINADETLLLGQYTLPPANVNPDGTLKHPEKGGNETPGGYTYAENKPDGTPYTYADAKTRALHRRLARISHGDLHAQSGHRRTQGDRGVERLAQPCAILAHRSGPDHVLPRRALA